MHGTASFLINSYLSNRDKYVVCDDYKSDVLPVNVGVPHGFVLGPLLFNIFINDLSELGMKNVLFADDAVFNAESENFHELVETFQRFVSALSDWLNTNKVIAHESKTKLMLFTSRIHPCLPDNNFYQNTLEWVSHIKYLGIL